MKDVSPSCSKTDSPKTPGGISKSLLTPCRRVGLSRKWKKGGGSPFVSPLSTHIPTAEIKESRETTKRKKCVEGDVCDEASETPKQQHNVSEHTPTTRNSSMNNSITTTPCRNRHILRTKSKTLSLSLNKSQESKDVPNSQENNKKESSNNPDYPIGELKSKENADVAIENKKSSKKSTKIVNKRDATEEIVSNNLKQTSPEEHVAKIVKTESKSKSKLSLKKSNSKSNSNTDKQNDWRTPENCKIKEKSPNNLTKECIVVIQNKIFKPDFNNAKVPKISQESDSEPDVPLSELKKESTENITVNDDDFIYAPPKKKIRKLSIIKPAGRIESSQSSQEDDKRTILIKKTYEKVMKPQKAKSTGSITQKDIDDMKARIEMKKKLLMAKAMSIDTKELRELIKRWQKGCQDALMELLDLMKKKLPDRQNMDYAEILETLKIPSELVGYDPENDCFLTPDDNNILLSVFKL